MLLAVAFDVVTPVGAGSVPPLPPPLPEASWSTIALMAATWVPAFCAKLLPYQPIQSQQPLGLGSEPLADVARLVLSTLACGNSTMIWLVSAQRV
jgi:hypothetical protein